MEVKLTNKCSMELWTPVKEEITEHAMDLQHYFSRIESIEIVAREDRRDHKHIFEVEMLVDCEHNSNIVVTGQSDEGVTAAFHRAWHKAKRSLRKYKEKIQSH